MEFGRHPKEKKELAGYLRGTWIPVTQAREPLGHLRIDDTDHYFEKDVNMQSENSPS